MSGKKKTDETTVDVALTNLYKTTFAGNGRKVLQDMMMRYGMINGTFNPDPMEMARREGRLEVIRDILITLNTDTHELMKHFESIQDAGFDNDGFIQ